LNTIWTWGTITLLWRVQCMFLYFKNVKINELHFSENHLITFSEFSHRCIALAKRVQIICICFRGWIQTCTQIYDKKKKKQFLVHRLVRILKPVSSRLFTCKTYMHLYTCAAFVLYNSWMSLNKPAKALQGLTRKYLLVDHLV
jgi:hypothetical protein